MLKYALLGFLQYRSMTGYELKQSMDHSTSNFWHAKLSQIYVTLKKMEEKGLVSSVSVEQESRPDRRVYSITNQGKDDLARWLRTPDVEIYPSKEPFLLKLFFSAGVEKEFLLTQLRIQRDLHQNLLNEYKTETTDIIAKTVEQAPHLKMDALLWEATRRAGEIIDDAIVRWLEETIEMVEQDF
jgi:DNA-binding PadR family transcriptional regulator